MLEDNALEVYKDKSLALSNALLQAREKTSLLESKIELIAIHQMVTTGKAKTVYDIDNNPYSVHYAVLTTGELKQLLDRKGGSFYKLLELAAVALKQKLYVYKDDKAKKFEAINIYKKVTLEDGILEIQFEPETEFLFLDLKDSYFTKIPLDIALGMKTNGGLQLYKLLRPYAYKLDKCDYSLSQEDQPELELYFDYAEFRMQLGYAAFEQDDIKIEAMKAHPDFEKILEMEKNPKYKQFTQFRIRVIEPGIEEINTMSDLYISRIEKVVGGKNKLRGLKIYLKHNVAFYAKINEPKKTDDEAEKILVEHERVKKEVTLSEPEKFEILVQLKDIFPEELSTRDILAIAEEGDYDLDYIIEKYELSKTRNNIDNLAGWLITALKKNYKIGYKPRNAKSAQPKNAFNSYANQREYDFEALERQLLSQ